MEGKKIVSFAADIDVANQWTAFVNRNKEAAAVQGEKATGKELAQEALVEYMERHPVKRKGK